MVDEVALKQFAAVSPASNNSNNSIQWVYINVQAYKHKCLLQSQKKNTEYRTKYKNTKTRQKQNKTDVVGKDKIKK